MNFSTEIVMASTAYNLQRKSPVTNVEVDDISLISAFYEFNS